MKAQNDEWLRIKRRAMLNARKDLEKLFEGRYNKLLKKILKKSEKRLDEK
jgi:uncharacterized protein HemY